MNKFKKEKFSDWEIKSLKEKYSLKGFWATLGLVLTIGLVGSPIIPFLPSRHGRRWEPPTSQEEYIDRVTVNLTVIPALLVLTFIFLALRSIIDLRLGYKRTGDFGVTSIIDLGPIKILVLDSWRLFQIKRRNDYFDKVRVGQRIQIKRTGTHRLIDYYAYDKKTIA